jgi:tRNA threonylcarbamoyladenosine modification (KEOPS) complex  Pcc1 subunit
MALQQLIGSCNELGITDEAFHDLLPGLLKTYLEDRKMCYEYLKNHAEMETEEEYEAVYNSLFATLESIDYEKEPDAIKTKTTPKTKAKTEKSKEVAEPSTKGNFSSFISLVSKLKKKEIENAIDVMVIQDPEFSSAKTKEFYKSIEDKLNPYLGKKCTLQELMSLIPDQQSTTTVASLIWSLITSESRVSVTAKKGEEKIVIEVPAKTQVQINTQVQVKGKEGSESETKKGKANNYAKFLSACTSAYNGKKDFWVETRENVKFKESAKSTSTYESNKEVLDQFLGQKKIRLSKIVKVIPRGSHPQMTVPGVAWGMVSDKTKQEFITGGCEIMTGDITDEED